MNLYLKYRPHTLDEVRGNFETLETLDKMLSNRDKCPHAIMFQGQTGCGKTTLARIVANRLECSREDFREVDVADYRGIDTIREIRKNAQFMPMNGQVRVWVLDEAHKLTGDAQNALLKILEDTPQHVYFVLCTTELQKIIPTVRSRCQVFHVYPLSHRQMLSLLRDVVKEEGEELDKKVYDQIIESSIGLPRNALQILEQVLSVDSETRMELAEQATEEQTQSIELCRALLQRKKWSVVSNILKGLKDQDPESIRRHVMAYCQSVLLGGEDDQAAHVLEEFMEPTYNTGFSGLVYASYVAINK